MWKNDKGNRKSLAFKSIKHQGILSMHGIHRQIQTSTFFYKDSRVPQQLRVPRYMPAAPSAHRWASRQEGTYIHT